MSNPRITNRNLFKLGTITASSQDPAFPAANAQADSPSIVWRSRNGAGSGNGLFIITASVNDRIDFDEGAAEKTASLTAASYTGTSLAAHVQAQMDSASGAPGIYTVAYSLTTGKFTISKTGNFTLRWESGTNTTRSAGTMLGFNVAADDTGAATYTSDYARYHYPYEYLYVDLGTATIYNSVAILNHNATSDVGKTIADTGGFYIDGADNAAFTTNLVTDAVSYNASNVYGFLGTARTKRYIRVRFGDPANPAGYVQIGAIWIGYYFDLDRDAQLPDIDGYEDPSALDYSDSQVLFSVERARPRIMSFPVNGLGATAAANIRSMALYNGVSAPLLICFSTSAPNTNSYLVYNAAPVSVRRIGKDTYTWEAALREAK